MTVSSIVVVGATGLLGEALIDRLAAHDDLGVEVVALASARSASKRVAHGEGRLKVRDVAGFTFAADQIVILCVPARVAGKLLPRVRESGARVIDFSGSLGEAAPVLPWAVGGGVSTDATAWRPATALAAHVATSVEPIRALAGIDDLRVSVLQAVSGRGQRGVEELAGQAARLLNAQSFDSKVFPAQIAFNVLPDADVAREIADLGRLLALADDAVSVARAWVSVFHGQVAQIEVITRAPLDLDTLSATWCENPRLELDSEATLSPVTDGTQADVVHIGVVRVRPHPGGGSRVSYLSVADEVRFASAANGIAISEILLKPCQ